MFKYDSAAITYTVTCGLDGSSDIDFEVSLNDRDAAAYTKARMLGQDLEEVLNTSRIEREIIRYERNEYGTDIRNARISITFCDNGEQPPDEDIEAYLKDLLSARRIKLARDVVLAQKEIYDDYTDWKDIALDLAIETNCSGYIKRYEKDVPYSQVLYCKYPGLEFKEELNASPDNSYANDPDYYWDDLDESIYEKLSWQDVKKLLDVHYTEDDVEPKCHFYYSGLLESITEELPHNEKVKIYVDLLSVNGKVIETREVDLMRFFDLHPGYFEEGGLFDATNEYISASLKRFVKESSWQFALKKDSKLIKDIEQWPGPKENGSWIDKDGTRMQPVIWFGLKDKKPQKTWTLDGRGMEFWFNEHKVSYFIEYGYDGHVGSYEGYIPDMKPIRESCPIPIEENDNPESIEEKTQNFFIEQYKKAHP